MTEKGLMILYFTLIFIVLPFTLLKVNDFYIHRKARRDYEKRNKKHKR